MSEQTHPTCETCAFFAKDARVKTSVSGKRMLFGFCRFGSPAPRVGPADDRWPSVNATEWCGEHPHFAAYLDRTQMMPNYLLAEPPISVIAT